MKKIVRLAVFGAFLVGFMANAQSEKIKGNGKIVSITSNYGNVTLIKK